MRNYIKDHFEIRLKERTKYDIETLTMDLEKYKEDVLVLTKNSEEIEWFPQFKGEFRKYPNSTIRVYEPLNLCIVTVGMNVITMYKL
jgi:hypothetical protein